MSQLIEIVRYRDSWPLTFEGEKNNLELTLGELCFGVHHVGSTAVPGLASKPIIDITLELKQYPPNNNVISILNTLEYEYKGESGIIGRHWFVKGKPRRFNLHVTPVEGDVLQRQLAFRNALRESPSKADEYLKIKLKNASNNDIDSYEYAQAKTSFIEAVLNEYQKKVANNAI